MMAFFLTTLPSAGVGAILALMLFDRSAVIGLMGIILLRQRSRRTPS